MDRPSHSIRTLPPAVVVPDTAPLVIPADAPSVGRARPAAPLRREGPAKLTGEAKYADDLVFPGAWFGGTIRSTEPHARLIGLELDDAFDWKRVVVVTADDIPGANIVSLIDDDQPVLVPIGGEIRHQAEACALIAAPDRATLAEAKRHVSLRTERLPAVFDPLKSDLEFAHYTVESGDAAAAMETAALVIEGTYRVGHQEQLYIENQAMIAVPREDGGITVHGSLQCPYYIHKAMKRALNMGDELAVVVQAETGGGFGGKEEYPSVIALHASLLALKCHKPVRMIYDRHEDISATTKRHPAVIRYRSGVSDTGELIAQEIEVIMDGGAYCTLTPVVLSRGTLHAGGPYRCPNVRITGRAMATNTPPNGAFRGFGAPQTEFAAEMQVNRIAEALDASPLDLRRRWVYREGDVTPTGQVLRESVAGIEVLEAAARASAFDRTHAQTRSMRESRTDGARVATGIGLALAWHGAGFTGSGEVQLASVASLELTDEGRIRILTASTEMGQGTKTIFPQLVADALGVEYDEVEIAPQDTSLVPDSGPTVASRTAMVVGGLLIRAAEKLRARVEEATGRPFAASYHEAGPMRIDERFVPYPGEPFDDKTYRGDAYPAFGWACAVAKVDVDLDTGEVTVRDCVSADDVGRAIHPVLAEGQVEGGTLQAIGYATIEEMKLIDGRYLNDRLATYLIPTSLDAPRIRSILVEKPYSGSPHGAKGIGELPMDVGAPAVVAAIHDAVGVWIHDLPATPERILAALSGGPDLPAPGVSLEAPRPATPPIEDLPAGGDEMPFRAPTDP
ncbi:MAG TPA: xanthine dehydrogenase family protein molybdopterin-binding subunit, partial [Candidatus Limnocylindria bacterium]|nr:xanthine dehydrogenase family protein molybdopterin-binding subunit [Candidatus Limnocylindria bacterium]